MKDRRRLRAWVGLAAAALACGCTSYGTAVVTGADGAAASPPRLDPGFGQAGVFRLDIATSGDEAIGLAPRAQGGVVALSAADCALVAVTAGGVLDPAFGGDGLARAPVACHASTLRVDAKRTQYLVAGAAPGIGAIVVATTFAGGAGKLGGAQGYTMLKSFAATGMDVAADGRIALTGTATGTKVKEDTADLAAARLSSEGQIDTDFASAGAVVVDGGGVEDPRGVIAEPGGAATVWGTQQPLAGAEGAGVLFRARFTGLGKLDATGVQQVPGPPKFSLPFEGLGAVVGLDGERALLAGHAVPWREPDKGANRWPWIGRLVAGAADASWGDGGFTVLAPDVAPGASLRALAVQVDGAVIAVGWRRGLSGADEAILVRLGADGRLDTGFGAAGVFALPLGEAAAAHAVAAASGGFFVGGIVGGGSTRRLFVVRVLVP